MAKRRMTLRFRLPPYERPRNAWRKAISREAVKAGAENLQYTLQDRLEIDVRLYLRGHVLSLPANVAA